MPYHQPCERCGRVNPPNTDPWDYSCIGCGYDPDDDDEDWDDDDDDWNEEDEE